MCSDVRVFSLPAVPRHCQGGRSFRGYCAPASGGGQPPFLGERAMTASPSWRSFPSKRIGLYWSLRAAERSFRERWPVPKCWPAAKARSELADVLSGALRMYLIELERKHSVEPGTYRRRVVSALRSRRKTAW